MASHVFCSASIPVFRGTAAFLVVSSTIAIGAGPLGQIKRDATSRNGALLSLIEETGDLIGKMNQIGSDVQEGKEDSPRLVAEQAQKTANRLSEIRNRLRRRVPVLARHVEPDEKGKLRSLLLPPETAQFYHALPLVVDAWQTHGDQWSKSIFQRVNRSDRTIIEATEAYHSAASSLMEDVTRLAGLLGCPMPPERASDPILENNLEVDFGVRKLRSTLRPQVTVGQRIKVKGDLSLARRRVALNMASIYVGDDRTVSAEDVVKQFQTQRQRAIEKYKLNRYPTPEVIVEGTVLEIRGNGLVLKGE